jgi:hypothetical protein
MSHLRGDTTTTAITSRSRNPYARRYTNANSTIASSPLEKDDTEKALEKLLFGDDEGFYKALKKQRGPPNSDNAVIPLGDDPSDDNVAGADDEGGEVDENENMEQVADDDVSIQLVFGSNYLSFLR